MAAVYTLLGLHRADEGCQDLLEEEVQKGLFSSSHIAQFTLAVSSIPFGNSVPSKRPSSSIRLASSSFYGIGEIRIKNLFIF